MKRLSLLLALLLAGCFHKQTLPPAPDVEQLRAQHRYAEALVALDAAQNTPDYAQRRNALLADIGEYQARKLDEIGELAKEQQFAEAQRNLAEARKQLPPSNELEQFADNLRTAAERYKQRNLDEIVQLRSSTLSKEQALYRQLQKAADDPALRELIARQQADTDYFAAQLAQLGARAFAQNEFTKAVQYLGQANQLAPSDEVAQQLKRAEQALAASKQKRQTARSTEREQHYREMAAALQQHLQQRDYVAARAQLEQLKGLGIHGDEVEALRVQLDTEITAYVERQIDAGNRLYSDGRLEEALQCWRQAAVLAPSPQLTERMEKAQRFIDRLEQLRAKQY